MKLNRISTLLCLLLLIVISFSGYGQTPSIKVEGATHQNAVRLQSLRIDVQIYGNIATTVMTMSFHNTSSRILEGELTFPMPEGVSVSGYALDINGKMRDAVPVDKAKATEAFESVEQRRVDPGLLERVEGNNFRTRIYPFPAGGSRIVKISYEEELHISAGGQPTYRHPLDYKQSIPEFSLKVNVSQSKQAPVLTEQPDGSFRFENKGSVYVAEMNRKNFLPAYGLVVQLPQTGELTTALMQKAGSSYYFLTNVFLKAPLRTHRQAQTIGLIWDVSLNGLQHDHQKELDLLGALIRKQKNLSIELALLNHRFTKAGVFVIRDGNWAALKEKLSHLVYDGGTDYSQINPNLLNVQEYLFFTDGLSGFGPAAVELKQPVYTVNSSSRADYSNLKAISSKTGGQFIDLNVLSVKEAMENLSTDRLQFIGVKSNAAIREVYPALPVYVDGYLSVAGIASSGAEDIVLQFGYGKTVTMERKVHLNAEKQGSGAIDVDKVWAQKKLNDLDVQYEQHKDEIRSLGQQFGLVTRNTSLLVLESVEDYVRYGITPPDELRADFDRQMKQRRLMKMAQKRNLMDDAFKMAEELKIWWSTSYTSKIYPKRGYSQAGTTSPAMALAGTVRGVETTSQDFEASPSALSEVVVTNAHGSVQKRAADKSVGTARKDEGPLIIVPEFKSDQDYMEKIKGNTEQAYMQYLVLRKDYLTTPTFYLDLSNWFWQQKDAEKALMILSNLTELELENAEIYKTLTYKFRERGNTAAELFTSRKVLEWRPMDPQSHRDYALALIDCGRYQEALNTLYSILNEIYSNEDNSRDDGIEEIIIAEINNLISLHSTKLSTSKIDKKLIFGLPVEVRVVMNWNKKDTDIDLWVTDPNGEKCYYGQCKTSSGGRISDDFTGGYGPEQFMIKKAVKGRYKIEVNYYGDRQLSISGPTTVMAEIYTHFGTRTQQRKIIALQLSAEKQGSVFIGEFTF